MRQARDKPVSNRINVIRHDNGNRSSCLLGSTGYCRATRDDDVYLETHKLGGKLTQPISFFLCISLLNDDVFPLRVPKFAAAPPESPKLGHLRGKRGGGKKSLSGDFLRALPLDGNPKS